MTRFEEALEKAVKQHFCLLFQVLMADPSPESLKRFQAGLKNLIEMQDTVNNVLDDIESDL